MKMMNTSTSVAMALLKLGTWLTKTEDHIREKTFMSSYSNIMSKGKN